MFGLKKSHLAIFILTIFLSACSSLSSNKPVSLGIDPSFFPLNVENQQPNIQGFCFELFAEIGKCSDMDFTAYLINNDSLQNGLQKGKYDLIVSAKQPEIYNQKEFIFSDLFLPSGPVLVVPVTSPILSIEDIKGKSIAVEKGSAESLLVAVQPEAIAYPYTSVSKVLNEVEEGSYDGTLVDVILATKYCNDLYSGKLHIVSSPLNSKGLRLIGLPKNGKKSIEEFNRCLHKLKENGTYELLLKKWSLM